MAPSYPPVPAVLDLCCGGKKCPVLRDDEGAIVIEDREQSPLPIRLTAEQARRVAEWLTARALAR